MIQISPHGNLWTADQRDAGSKLDFTSASWYLKIERIDGGTPVFVQGTSSGVAGKSHAFPVRLPTTVRRRRDFRIAAGMLPLIRWKPLNECQGGRVRVPRARIIR